MKLLYWGIYDNYTVRSLVPKGEKPILIRVLEPNYKLNEKIPYKIKTIDKYIDVLELYFEDVSAYPPEKYKDRFVLFNKDIGNEIIEFINKHDFDEIVVHCSAGVSRSSAVMICISKLLGLSYMEKSIYECGRFRPNSLVLNEFSKISYDKKKCFYEHKLINTNEYYYEDEELDVILDTKMENK